MEGLDGSKDPGVSVPPSPKDRLHVPDQGPRPDGSPLGEVLQRARGVVLDLRTLEPVVERVGARGLDVLWPENSQSGQSSLTSSALSTHQKIKL